MKIFLFIILLLTLERAHCWSAFGHEIVGDVAQEYLSDSAKKAIAYYLKEYNASLANVSTWADEIKQNPKYHYTIPFHYANTPKPDCVFNFTRDCSNKGCVVSAIFNYTKYLLDEKIQSSHEQKVEALKFIVHFLGDVHQPLHVFWGEVSGGNDIKVTFYGSHTNLHTVWDQFVPRKRIVDYYDNDIESYVDYLGRRLKHGDWRNKITEWLKCPPSSPHSIICPEEWAKESGKLACEYGIKGVSDGSALGDKYYHRAFPIAETQFVKAGVRLAMILNYIFRK